MSPLFPLVAHAVSKAYGDRVVLDGVDLLANPGEPVGLVGENGVGKSTLLRLLVAVEERDSGTVNLPPEVGYVAQDLTFEVGATVADVLSDALAPLHAAVHRLEELAHRLDQPAAADEYAETLAWATHHAAWDADRRASGPAGISVSPRSIPSGRCASYRAASEPGSRWPPWWPGSPSA